MTKDITKHELWALRFDENAAGDLVQFHDLNAGMDLTKFTFSMGVESILRTTNEDRKAFINRMAQGADTGNCMTNDAVFMYLAHERLSHNIIFPRGLTEVKLLCDSTIVYMNSLASIYYNNTDPWLMFTTVRSPAIYGE